MHDIGAALLMDGFTGHDRNGNSQVTVFAFPSNVTVYQPMDQGIIATQKPGSRTEYCHI